MGSYYLELRKDIQKLKLSPNTSDLLKKNKIDTLEKIIKENKASLKKLGFTANQIIEIEIKLQLEGLDLNMKLGY